MKDNIIEIVENDIRFTNLFRINGLFNSSINTLRNRHDYFTLISIVADLCEINDKLNNEIMLNHMKEATPKFIIRGDDFFAK